MVDNFINDGFGYSQLLYSDGPNPMPFHKAKEAARLKADAIALSKDKSRDRWIYGLGGGVAGGGLGYLVAKRLSRNEPIIARARRNKLLGATIGFGLGVAGGNLYVNHKYKADEELLGKRGDRLMDWLKTNQKLADEYEKDHPFSYKSAQVNTYENKLSSEELKRRTQPSYAADPLKVLDAVHKNIMNDRRKTTKDGRFII